MSNSSTATVKNSSHHNERDMPKISGVGIMSTAGLEEIKLRKSSRDCVIF